jgi:hypothetical protein
MFLNPSRESSYYLVITGLIIYLGAVSMLGTWHAERAGDASKYTYDFNVIVGEIEGTGNNVYLDGTIPYAPYAPRFYLSEQHLSPLDIADYVITGDRDYAPDNLTPDNQVLYLFKRDN